jgi:hypothetical protein
MIKKRGGMGRRLTAARQRRRVDHRVGPRAVAARLWRAMARAACGVSLPGLIPRISADLESLEPLKCSPVGTRQEQQIARRATGRGPRRDSSPSEIPGTIQLEPRSCAWWRPRFFLDPPPRLSVWRPCPGRHTTSSYVWSAAWRLRPWIKGTNRAVGRKDHGPDQPLA